MANLKTDSPLCLRVVRAFLDFLDSVEPAPGVDIEGLEVARECLSEVFKLDSTSTNDCIKPGLLVNLFRSLETNEDQNIKSNSIPGGAPSSSNAQNQNTAFDSNHLEASRTLGDDWTQPSLATGVSKDELFGQFFAALEKIHFFKSTSDGNDDPVQLDKTTSLFHDALNDMEKAGCQSYNQSSLAETFKSQGNRAMQSKMYSDAIELYSCAISLCENNSIYYCNRAAAFTQIQKYAEAIKDCLKSIEIDPNYSKAYSRLGLAYYAHGNYRDAIDKGFSKALLLDPNNESVKENIQVAAQKLREERQPTGGDQNKNTSSRDSEEFNSEVPPFPSMPFNASDIPVNFTNVFRNMASQFYPGEHPQPQGRQGGGGDSRGAGEPEINMGTNVNLNLGENIPEEVRGALRSVMEMFSGTAPVSASHSHGNPQDTNTTNERSTS